MWGPEKGRPAIVKGVDIDHVADSGALAPEREVFFLDLWRQVLKCSYCPAVCCSNLQRMPSSLALAMCLAEPWAGALGAAFARERRCGGRCSARAAEPVRALWPSALCVDSCVD